jgi:hypothetical protein
MELWAEKKSAKRMKAKKDKTPAAKPIKIAINNRFFFFVIIKYRRTPITIINKLNTTAIFPP